VRYYIHLTGETRNKKGVEVMIQQTVMPFKLKRTEEGMTPRSGLVLYAEFMKAMGVEEMLSTYFPRPGSGRGYGASDYVKPLSLVLYGGGETIEDMREIREDSSLRQAIGSGTIPSSSATGDWLRRMGRHGGICGMEKVNDTIVRKVLKKDGGKEYSLIVDPTIIESGKREARMTYSGFKGYRPVVATLKETGLTIAYEFKEGNDNGGRVDILKKAFRKMPLDKNIKHVLLDSEYYTNDVMDYLNTTGAWWFIAVDKDKSVMDAIRAIPENEWSAFHTRDGIETDRDISETVHITGKGKSAFRMIVLRWQDRQGDLFDDIYHYHCIATNTTKGSAENVIWHYNERAHIENHIKEIKGGFGMDRLPSGDFHGNAVHFGIGIMTYNLFIAQKLLTMHEGWKRKTIKSIRWLLIEVAGKLIKHGRQKVLKIAVSLEKYRIYLKMRRRTYELSLE
jgi:hypothetical protein